MLVRVALLHDLEEAIPVLLGLGLHQIELVRHRPPDVAVGRQPRDDVAKVAVIHLGGHRAIAPAVVRVEEDDVGLDAQVAQVTNALFQVAEESGVEVSEVPASTLTPSPFLRCVQDRLPRGRGERIESMIGRFVLVEGVMLGEDAHPHLVERRGFQRCERLLFKFVALVIPHVAGRADRKVRRAILVGKVMHIAHTHRPVIARRRRCAVEHARLPIQRGDVAARCVRPRADCVRHEADFVQTVAIVEAIHVDDAVFVCEARPEGYIDKRIAPCRAVQRHLENIPTFHMLHCHSSIIVDLISVPGRTQCTPVSQKGQIAGVGVHFNLGAKAR